MTKKKKTFRKFINEQVLGVKQKEKQFDKFEDFVKDVKGIKPPENKAESFQEFINEARGYEFDNDSVDKFDNMVIESKIEREKQKLEERKTRIDPSPIVLTNRQIEEMNRRRIIEEINEVLKHRDPVLVKMSFQQWLNIPHNKFVFELDEYQAKRLYEQDMSRVEKYEELKKKSGGGKIKVTTAAEDPFTPAALFDPTTPDGGFWDSTDASKNTFHSNLGVSQWDSSAGVTGYFSFSQYETSAPTTFPNGARGFYGAGTTTASTKGFGDTNTGHTLSFSGPGNAWSLGFVIHIPQAVIDSGAGGTAGFFKYSKFMLGYRGADNHLVLNTNYHNTPSDNNLKVAVTTGGTYIVIGTCDGTTTGQRLYVNGVTQGPPATAMNIKPALTGFSLYAKSAPDVITGDALIIEREITASEVSALHGYWSNKFT